MLPALGLHGTKDGADDGAADADEGDHDDEPADRHRLRHHDAAARLAALLAGVHRTARPANKRNQSVFHVHVSYLDLVFLQAVLNQSEFCIHS